MYIIFFNLISNFLIVFVQQMLYFILYVHVYINYSKIRILKPYFAMFFIHLVTQNNNWYCRYLFLIKINLYLEVSLKSMDIV